MVIQTISRFTGNGDRSSRARFMKYANGHIDAANNATLRVTIGRFGTRKPTMMIQTERFEPPRTKAPGSNGRLVSRVAIEKATTTSNSMPSWSMVADGTTRYCCAAIKPTANSTLASRASELTGSCCTGRTSGCSTRCSTNENTVVMAASRETQHSRREAWLTSRGDSATSGSSGPAVICPGVVARTMSCMSNP